MSPHTETEIKLYCPDLQAVADALDAAGATLVTSRVFERNVRYENSEKTFNRDGVVLRLRQDERARLTYKGPGTVTDDIMARYEAEVEIDSMETMGDILEVLGYTPDIIYEKYRTTYRLDEAEIVLDEMPYGNFVEIEAEAAAIEAKIQRLGLSKAQRFGVSYVGLFYMVRRNLELEIEDLTFENFEDVEVPDWAFLPLLD